jgi:hypothetical protein
VSDDPSLIGRMAVAEAAIEETLDPGAAARREEAAREHDRTKERRRAFLIQMMQHPEGRLWLREVLERFHTFELRLATTPGGMRDDVGTMMLMKEQACGWWLWEQLDEADPVVASRVRRGA